MIDTIQQSPPTNAFNAATWQFRADVLRGLGAPQKELPCKYFYDEIGSDLFERITEVEEYYPTRTELDIMERHAAEMAGLLGPDCLLIEYGSGSSVKTRLLLNHLRDPAGYVPIDVSGEHLRRSANGFYSRRDPRDPAGGCLRPRPRRRVRPVGRATVPSRPPGGA